jgi:hypothetical protein
LKVVLKPNNPMLAWSCESLTGRLEAHGYEVEIEGPIERRDIPSEVVESLLLLIVHSAFSEEVYPKLRQLIIEWFTEEPPPKPPTRVQLYDQEGGVQDDFRLSD